MHTRIQEPDEKLHSSIREHGRMSTGRFPFRLSVLILVLVSVSCAGNDRRGHEASLESNELPVIIIRSIAAEGPTTLPQLIDVSPYVVSATLTSIDENFGIREGPNEDEPTAPYVELIGLNFTVDAAIKGGPPAQITIPWYGYARDNIDGRPGERSALIELEGVRFSSDDIDSSFVLFLKQADDGSLDVVNAINGMARVDGSDGLSPLTNGGIFGNGAASLTVTDVANHVRSRETTEGDVIPQ